eukprot:361422-Chlamydomonas_euryale.AAC.3
MGDQALESMRSSFGMGDQASEHGSAHAIKLWRTSASVGEDMQGRPAGRGREADKACRVQKELSSTCQMPCQATSPGLSASACGRANVRTSCPV